MPKSFGLLSKVTLVAHRIGVHGDLRMIALLCFVGAEALFTRTEGGRDASIAEQICLPAGEAFQCSSAERFRWTNAAVLDTVRWAKAAVASKPSDRKITKGVRRG